MHRRKNSPNLMIVVLALLLATCEFSCAAADNLHNGLGGMPWSNKWEMVKTSLEKEGTQYVAFHLRDEQVTAMTNRTIAALVPTSAMPPCLTNVEDSLAFVEMPLEQILGYICDLAGCALVTSVVYHAFAAQAQLPVTLRLDGLSLGTSLSSVASPLSYGYVLVTNTWPRPTLKLVPLGDAPVRETTRLSDWSLTRPQVFAVRRSSERGMRVVVYEIQKRGN
jgi:hypothetical protein